MINWFKNLIVSFALPSLLIGLLIPGLLKDYPQIGPWITNVCIILLGLIFFGYLIARMFNIIVNRRFANSIFVLDDDLNMALILHPHYKRYQPPGSRLGYHEAPHLAVKRVMEKELGLKPESYSLVSNETELITIGKNTIVPKPYLVKIEKGNHRLGVSEHYDYVFICLAKGTKPNIESNINPKWFSIEEVEELKNNNITQAAWEDVIPIYQRIVENIDQIRSYELVKL